MLTFTLEVEHYIGDQGDPERRNEATRSRRICLTCTVCNIYLRRVFDVYIRSYVSLSILKPKAGCNCIYIYIYIMIEAAATVTCRSQPVW